MKRALMIALAVLPLTAGGAAADPPLLTLPGDMTIEANGPDGAVVIFTVTATKGNGQAVPVTCSPPSGTIFSLGPTIVECLAIFEEDVPTTGSFSVTVVDTTPPTLTVPADLELVATTTAGIDGGDGRIATFLASAVATDLVTQQPTITDDAPATFPIGTTIVTFTAADDEGNAVSKAATVTVAPPPPPPGSPPPSSPPSSPPSPPPSPTPPDRTPPGNVVGAQAQAGSRTVVLRWKAPVDADLDHFEVRRSVATEPAASAVRVYAGAATRFADSGLKNGVQYRYVIISVDRAGNRSAGVALTALPRALLWAPKDGQRVTRPPLLVWAPTPGATYYNVQLYRGRTKILTAWPKGNRYKVAPAWTFSGKRMRLTPGTYRWYVWPAFGQRSAARYGDLLGSSGFVLRHR